MNGFDGIAERGDPDFSVYRTLTQVRTQVSALYSFCPSRATVTSVAREGLRRLPATAAVIGTLWLCSWLAGESSELYFNITLVALIGLNMVGTKVAKLYPFAGSRLRRGAVTALAVSALMMVVRLAVGFSGCNLADGSSGFWCAVATVLVGYPKVVTVVAAALMNLPKRAHNMEEALVIAGQSALSRRVYLGEDCEKDSLVSWEAVLETDVALFTRLPGYMVWMILTEPERFDSSILNQLISKAQEKNSLELTLDQARQTVKGNQQNFGWGQGLVEAIWGHSELDDEQSRQVFRWIGAVAQSVPQSSTEKMQTALSVLQGYATPHRNIFKRFYYGAVNFLNAPSEISPLKQH